MKIKIQKGRFTIFLVILAAITFMLVKGCSQKPVDIPNKENEAKGVNILVLVNKSNKLPDDYAPNIAEGRQYDKILLEDLDEMRDAARSEGVVLFVRDGYRSRAEQERVYNESADGIAALPGHSEHETGLAIDFSLEDNAEETSKTWQWLSKNAYKYGFILRYPEGKEHITGYDYEPWHYRYVGKTHAKTIYEKGLTLEEYLIEL